VIVGLKMPEYFKAMLTKYRRPITFAIVGVINTAVDFCIFSIICLFATVPVSQAAGYITGLTCSFFLNKYITFKNNTKNFKQIFLFLLVNGITLITSVAAIYLFHNIIGIQEHIAKLFFVTPITMVLNYLGYKYIVFR